MFDWAPNTTLAYFISCLFGPFPNSFGTEGLPKPLPPRSMDTPDWFLNANQKTVPLKSMKSW